MKCFINTDGGSRGNPGPAATGVVMRNEQMEIISETGTFLGVVTNNEAEYKALIEGLTLAKQKGFTEVECLLDSELVVHQLNGVYKVKNENIQKNFLVIKDLETNFSKVTYKHIRRELNKEADKLVNKVLDSTKDIR